MNRVRFLTLAEVLLIHNDQIENYGGEHGLRDAGLLSSAVAMPQAMFDGNYLHETLFDKAAAYLFYLCQNHPFIDGNKRVALASTLVFLDLHDIQIADDDDFLYEMVIAIASGKTNKAPIGDVLQKLSTPPPT